MGSFPSLLPLLFLEAGEASERWGSPHVGSITGVVCHICLERQRQLTRFITTAAEVSLSIPGHQGASTGWVSPLALAHVPQGSPFWRGPHAQHSLFFDFICCSPSNLLRVGLGFASVPQVNEGFVYVEDNHGSPGPQATTVTGHFQQVSFHGHFSSHTVQPPLACRGHQRHGVRPGAAGTAALLPQSPANTTPQSGPAWGEQQPASW